METVKGSHFRQAIIKTLAYAHSSAVYLVREGQTAITGHAQIKALAQKWIQKLNELEKSLENGNIEKLVFAKAGQELSLKTLKAQRAELLKEIAHSRKYFDKLASSAKPK